MRKKVVFGLMVCSVVFGAFAETDTGSTTMTGSVVNDNCTLTATPIVDLGVLDGAALELGPSVSVWVNHEGGNRTYYDTGYVVTVTASCTGDGATNATVKVDHAGGRNVISSSANTDVCVISPAWGDSCSDDYVSEQFLNDGATNTFNFPIYIRSTMGSLGALNESVSFVAPFSLIIP